MTERCGCKTKRKYLTLTQGGTAQMTLTIFAKALTKVYDFSRGDLVDVEVRLPVPGGDSIVLSKLTSGVALFGGGAQGQILVTLTKPQLDSMLAATLPPDAELEDQLQDFIVFVTDGLGRHPAPFHRALLIMPNPAP